MDLILISLAFCAFLLVLIFLRELYFWLRNCIPKTVYCWFCHCKTKVAYHLCNSWFCPSCDQYNGFNKDGDYNRIIDNQYEEKLNFSINNVGRTKEAWKSTNRLCERCNHNQELKVQQLASFEPLNAKHYDIEIEHYREQLEKCYKLCSKCEELLSKIFTNERNIFSIPRRLATKLIIKPEVTGFARLILHMNLLVSLILSISAYIKLNGVPVFLLEYSNKYNHINIPFWLIKANYILIIGLALNIIGWINTKSIGILLNSLSWLIVLILTTYPQEFKYYIVTLQAISGIISCGVSIFSLTRNQKRSKGNLKIFNASSTFVSNSFSTEPSKNYSTSSFVENISQFPQNNVRISTNNIKPTLISPPKTPTSMSNIIKPPKNWPENINNGIRDLHLSNNTFSGNSNMKNCQQKNGNIGEAWWTNGLKQRKSINTQKNTSPPQNGFRPPSTTSSGFSDMIEDCAIDDCASCTGNSPICRHACHFTPTPQQFTTCFYAAAYYQRLLYSSTAPPSTPPSPTITSVQSQSQSSIYDPFSYLYTLPVLALIISNVSLLWTVYNNNNNQELING